MYERFYNLTEEPFRLSPNSRFCYRHTTYKKAFAYMQYALHRGEGFVMVTGRPGTGKTTLINELTATMSQSETVFANLSSTQLEGDDLLRMVAFNFGLDAEHSHKASLLYMLENHFRKTQDLGRRPLLIIDEAQGLSRSALEELRLMTNLQQHNIPLLQIFLVGQEELRDLVMSPQLEQLHQRIVASCHLDPLGQDETRHFIEHRLNQVNWRQDPDFDPGIYPLIHRFSLGIPRWINLICSRLMLHGMVEEKHYLDTRDMAEVLQGLLDEQLLPARHYTDQEELLEQAAKSTPKPRSQSSLHKASQPAQQSISPSAAAAADLGNNRTMSAVGSTGSTNANTDSLPSEPKTEKPFAIAANEPAAEEMAGDGRINENAQSHQRVPTNSLAALLYTQLQPQLLDKPTNEHLHAFLDFIDGREIQGKAVALPADERRHVEALGPAAWFKREHEGLDTSDLNEDILEIMGLVTWLKRCQPNLENDHLETIGLVYRFMRAGEAA